MTKNDLIACFQDTLKTAESRALKHKTLQAEKSNKIYMEGFVAANSKGNEHSSIIVEENTTFASAKKYCALGRTAVLNFANPETPGGGVRLGAMAQEECLCRSSNLYPCLSASNVIDDYYLYHRSLKNSFYSDRLIYTRNVTVFKDDSVLPQLMPKREWFDVDVITCAAPYLAKRKYTNKTALKQLLKGRIKNIFEAAVDNNDKVIILGAFGCGAFKNPPEIVASAFNEVIKENDYTSKFSKIVFAIKRTNKAPCPNLMAFEYEFLGISAEANMLRFTMPNGFDAEERQFKEWQQSNPYFKKQFSILGDSISTLDGYIPKGYNCFYCGENCEKTGVKEMGDTWWGQVIDFFGGELLVNNSWSGSRVTKLPNVKELFPSGCSNERTKGLHINNVTPDVIIVYLGINDFANGVSISFEDTETFLFTGQFPETFSDAYEYMIQEISRNYPKAEIWCCTLSETYISERPDFIFPHSYTGTNIEEYNEIIRHLSRENRCKLIDLYKCNTPYNTVDGSHPTSDGMTTIAKTVIGEMTGDNAPYFKMYSI